MNSRYDIILDRRPPKPKQSFWRYFRRIHFKIPIWLKLLLQNYVIVKNGNDQFIAGRFGLFGIEWVDGGEGRLWIGRRTAFQSYAEALNSIKCYKFNKKIKQREKREEKNKQKFHIIFKDSPKN